MAVNSRAYAFIIQEKNGVWQLLVFQKKGASQTSPYHIPGGGVDPGETPSEGVIREIEEESGLVGLVPTQYIGQWIREEHDTILQRHFFLFYAPNSLPDHWEHMVTGTGDDAGIIYRYKWILPNEALRLHLIYHPYLNAKHLPLFFPDPIFLGLNDQMLYLVPYSNRWPFIFSAEADILLQTIGQKNIASIEHIGSTSVWDMPAKPIIDIAIGLHDNQVIPEIISPLKQLGYQYKGPNGIPGRHYFKKKNEKLTFFHLHIFHKNSRNLKLHIQSRDALNRSFQLANDYKFLKLQLWVQNLEGRNRARYQAGKIPFFKKLTKRFN